MNDEGLAARALELLAGEPYFNVATASDDPAEARKAFALVYPGEALALDDFLDGGQKRFYRATPQRAWLNCPSERELSPSTVKMREEIPLALLTAGR